MIGTSSAQKSMFFFLSSSCYFCSSALVLLESMDKFEHMYDYVEPHMVVQIWEFGYDGELISNVAVDMAPADQLYKTPPPRSHNTLDEVDIIAREIKERRILVPHGELFLAQSGMSLYL